MLNKLERKLKEFNKFKKIVELYTNSCIIYDPTTKSYSKKFKKFPELTKEELNNFNKFRKQRKPCSCWMCSPKKYNRNIKHKNNLYKE